MKLRFNAVAARFTRRTRAPTAPEVVPRPSCQPQPPPAQTAAQDQPRAQVAPGTRRRLRWALALGGLAVLVAGSLAANRINFYHPPVVASYNTRLAELDSKLSRALGSELRAAGFEFDAAIVSVEPPACQRAVCLVKGLGQQDHREGWPGEMSVQHAGNGTWLFAGTGRLVGLKFDVDAAAEMRRLAESTPPQFPQVAMTAASVQARRQIRSPYNGEYEVLLSAPTEGAQSQWLDLETGRCLMEPDWDYFGRRLTAMHWLRTNGVDLSIATYGDGAYALFALHLAIVPVAGGLWFVATPEEIVSHAALRAARQVPQGPISPAQDQTDTYLFRTEGGTFGILRVLGFHPASQQLRMLYKLAGPAAKAGT